MNDIFSVAKLYLMNPVMLAIRI